MSNPVNELTPLLIVAEMKRSLAFYRDRLGFQITQDRSSEGKLVVTDPDGYELCFQKSVAD